MTLQTIPPTEAAVDPETGALAFEYGDRVYQLVFDMKATAFFEREAELSMIDALKEIEVAQEAGKSPKVSTLAYLIQAALRRHHPEVTAEKALRMVTNPTVMAALGVIVKTSSPPPAPGNRKAPASETASTGATKAGGSKGSSKRHSKRV